MVGGLGIIRIADNAGEDAANDCILELKNALKIKVQDYLDYCAHNGAKIVEEFASRQSKGQEQ